MAKKARAPKVKADANSSPSFWSKYKEELLWSAGLVVLIALVYGQVASYPFIDFDDGDFVSGNEVVQAGITWPGLRYAFESFDQSSWHPVTWISHMAVCHFAGLDPGPHHMVNVVLHGASTVLLLFFLTQLTGAIKPSVMAAAVFAVHPMHVETVVWIAQRKEVLAALFGIVTLLFWLKWTRTKSPGWYWTSLAFFLLASMSKPTVVTLPFLLLLLDHWPLERRRTVPLSRLLFEKIPFLLLSAAISITTYIGQQSTGSMGALGHVPLLTRLASVPVNYTFYLQKTFWPVGLAPHYPFWGVVPAASLAVSLVLLAAITAVALWQVRRSPYILVGWLWFLGVIVPMSGLVYVGGSIHSDRFTYMAHIGFCLMLFWGLPPLLKDHATPARLGLAAGVLVALMSFRSLQQVSYWQDNYTLFRHTIDSTENNDVANWLAARALVREQRIDEAISHAKEAVRIRPSDFALVTLADAQLRKGENEASLETAERAVKLFPQSAEAHFGRGLALAKLYKRIEAIPSLQMAAKLTPDPFNRAQAYFEIGRCLVEEGKEDESITYFQNAIELEPTYYLARKNLAFSLMHEKRIAEAFAHFRMLAGINSQDIDVRNALQYIASLGLR